MLPRRPPNVGSETAFTSFRHGHCKPREHIQKENIAEVRGQLIRSNSRIFSATSSSTSIYMCSVTNLDLVKGTISEVRVHAGAKFGHTVCWSIANAVRVHAGTTQVDFEVDRPPPADSPPGDLLITMVKETVILYEKDFRK